VFRVCAVHFSGSRGCGQQQIEGVLVYFTHLRCQKHIEDDVGDVRYVSTQKNLGENDPLVCFIHLIMQEYDSKCLKMYLITLKVSKIC
jgi:hypothetical protein